MARQWLLLRGLARDQRHWGNFTHTFREHFSSDNVLCCDLPGSGELSHITSPKNISHIVDAIRSHYHRELAQAPKLSLLAVSLGGMIAADWMHRYPDEINHAIIINSSSRLNPIWQRLMIGNFLKILLSAADTKTREHKIVEIISNNTECYDDLSESWARFQKENPLSYSTLINQLLAAARFSPPPIRHPILLLASRKDRLVNPACSIKLADYWNAPLRWHPTGGHDLTTDAPGWVIDTVKNWLKNI